MKGIKWTEILPNPKAKRAIIVGSGTSLSGFNFGELNLLNCFIIAVNGAGNSLPMANAWFTLDPWGLNGPQLPKKFYGKMYAAVPDDYGTPSARCPAHRVTPDRRILFLHRLMSHNYVDILSDSAFKLRLSEDRSCISTGNSGYGALNLAYHLHAEKILLLGIDGGSGYYYNSTQRTRPLNSLPKLFESAKEQLDKRGTKVFNGSPNSSVKCFDRGTIEQGLSWIIS